MRKAKDCWQHRHAIQIVSQLPDDEKDALAVLECAKYLVQHFLSGELFRPTTYERRPTASLFSFSTSASSRRARSTVKPSGRPR